MKIVFRGYTDKNGMPSENEGYCSVLNYLNGLKEKDLVVRIDIDKRNTFSLEETDFFFPSLKIGKLEIKKVDDDRREFEATFSTNNRREVFMFFKTLGEYGNPGHSYEILIGKKDLYIDGDGADYLVSINGVDFSDKRFKDKYKWAEIYNMDLEEMDNVNNKITEGKLREIIKESLSSILNESFSSPILSAYAKQHGGIAVGRNGGLRDGAKAFHIKKPYSSIDVSKITDDMLVGEPFDYNEVTDMSSDKFNNAVVFNDGWAIGLKKDAEVMSANRGERLCKRSGSGIGDTGDHNKSRDGFVGNGKSALSAPYNGYSVSDDAGYSQGLRQAHDFNKSVGDRATVFDINNRGRELVRQHYRMNESELKTIVSESVKSVLKEVTDYGNNLFGSANLNPTTKDKYGVTYDEYLTISHLINDIVNKFGDGRDFVENYANRSTTAYFNGKIEDRPEVFEKIKQYCLEHGYETTMEDSFRYSGQNRYDAVEVNFKKI